MDKQQPTTGFKTRQDLKKFLYILWVALLASQGTILYTSTILQKNAPEGRNDMGFNVLVGIVVLVVAVVYFMHKKVRRISKSSELENGPEFNPGTANQLIVFSIITWALCESLTIIGVVTPLVAGKSAMELSYSFIALGIGFHLIRKPSL
jgi:hypothetical protein